MACTLQAVTIKAHKNQGAFSPSLISKVCFAAFLALLLGCLPISIVIAKQIWKGRQEDTQVFMICYWCSSKVMPSRLSSICDCWSSWYIYVSDFFFSQENRCKASWDDLGTQTLQGRLWSRVTCHNFGHISDTFDHILDLSLDIFKCNSLREALRRFVAVDHLKGVDKYKCKK